MKDAIQLDVFGHSTVLVRIGSCHLLFDPHLNGDFGEGHFGYSPDRRIDLTQLPPLDAIVITHPDQFDARSLARLPRGTPVHCPPDGALLCVLERLGFTEVRMHAAWSLWSPCPGVQFLLTPCAGPAPARGIALRRGDVTVWLVAGTRVRDCTVVGQVLKTLGVQKINLLVHSIAGLSRPADHRCLDLGALTNLTMCDGILLLPDAGCYRGRSAWMNDHGKTLSSRQLKAQFARLESPPAILDGKPGDRFCPDAQDPLRRDGGGCRMVHPKAPDAEITTFPGWGITPLVASHDIPPAVMLFQEDFARATEPAVQPLAGRIVSAPDGPRELVPLLYRFLLVGTRAEVLDRIEVSLDARGVLTGGKHQVADIEVAISTSDYCGIRSGELSFATACTAGLLREIRPGLAVLNPAVAVIQVGEPLPEQHVALLSGTYLLQLVLGLGVDLGRVTRDREVAVALGEAQPVEHSASDPLPHSSTPADIRWPAVHTVLSGLQATLLRGQDPSVASGFYQMGKERHFVGLLGRGRWPRLAPRTHISTGRLVLYSLLEGQPHLGGSVRFPAASYRALLENILESPILKWEVWTPLPPGLPPWRAASLVPIEPSRLSQDLAARSWPGLISTGSPQNVQYPWWCGLPPLARARSEPSRTLPAECYGLELPANDPQWSSRALIDHLLRGDFRYGWTLPAAETYQSFPLAQSLGLDVWAEMVAVRVLAGALESGGWGVSPVGGKKLRCHAAKG